MVLASVSMGRMKQNAGESERIACDQSSQSQCNYPLEASLAGKGMGGDADMDAKRAKPSVSDAGVSDTSPCSGEASAEGKILRLRLHLH